MEKTLGKEFKDQKDRVGFLQDNCDKIEERGYMKHFSHEELARKKEALSEVTIELREIEIRKKEAAAIFKAEAEPLKEELGILISEIKAKAVFVKERCFKFTDHSTRTVGFYNQDGDLIEQRPMYADEMQTTIFNIAKTGTDNQF